MKKVLVGIISFTAVFAISTGAVAYFNNKTPSYNFSQEDMAALKQGYMEGCTEAGSQFYNYCDCTYESMLTTLGQDKLIDMFVEYEQTKELQPEMLPAVSECENKL